MKILTRRDLTAAVVTGLTTGVIAWLVLTYLGTRLPHGISPVVLVPLIPVLWLIGVQLGYLLALVASPFEQFGRFAAIGFANTAVDFGILYILIAFSGHASGGWYTLFKSLSFSVAIIHSYFWNKYWAFDAGKRAMTSKEVISFLLVSLASLLVNVGAASIVVAIMPLGGLTVAAWAGVGAAVGSAAALIFNFIGLRLFVF